MTSWSARYRAGECFAVWDELRAYGPDGVPDALHEDAEEVARETMRRVAANVDVIVERLTAVGYTFAYPEDTRQTPISRLLPMARLGIMGWRFRAGVRLY
ncbi:hypothetical protein [Microbispora hainanensis]|uniref:hypothetical protein n=1 Tax=Microbispora hainanensis TaxID=568844 RepID=UPI0033CE1B27